MRKNSLKNQRINNEVQRIMASVISGELKDPRVSGLVSVVAVNVATDLKTCKAYISVLGDSEDVENTRRGLLSASGYIRSRIAKELNLRNTPAIEFIMDQSIEYGVEMSHKIDELLGGDSNN